jgi:hypothetical protein
MEKNNTIEKVNKIGKILRKSTVSQRDLMSARHSHRNTMIDRHSVQVDE